MFLIYSKPDCHLCDIAKDIVYKIADEFGIEVREINIQEDRVVFEKYKYEIPVVFLDDNEVFRHRTTETELREIVVSRRSRRG